MKGGIKMKTQIKIIKHEDKTSEGGKDYTRFSTSKGWMSAFEKDIIEELKKCDGRTVSVELQSSEKGDRVFQNIRKFYGLVAPGLEELKQANEESEEIIAEIVNPQTMKPIVKSRELSDNSHSYNPTSMYVSYAKDIFCELIGNTEKESEGVMQRSIELVKQAHKAFE